MENAIIVGDLKGHRRDRIAGYGLIVLGAIFALFFSGDSQVAQHVMGHYARAVFIVIFIGSALLCFLGSLTDQWIFEYVGLLPLLGSFAIYGVSVIALGVTSAGLVVLPTGLSMLGFSLLFKARRIDLQMLYRHELEARRA